MAGGESAWVPELCPVDPALEGQRGGRPRTAVPAVATGWQHLPGLREQVSPAGRPPWLTMNLRDERAGEKVFFFLFIFLIL